MAPRGQFTPRSPADTPSPLDIFFSSVPDGYRRGGLIRGSFFFWLKRLQFDPATDSANVISPNTVPGDPDHVLPGHARIRHPHQDPPGVREAPLRQPIVCRGRAVVPEPRRVPG